MKVAVYTSFTFSYLAKAEVLGESLKRIHPDWHVIALVSDRNQNDFNLEENIKNFDEILWSEDLNIDSFENWISEHNIVEACTAVKGKALYSIASRGDFDIVIYLDPDTVVFNSLEPLLTLCKEYEVILTPHQITCENSDDDIAIIDNELGSTKHGVYNLGFVCIRTKGEGLRFSKWWSDRLQKYCREDIANGMFTDQKWCDLVPAYFDNVFILRDPGYNVASWNVSNRILEFSETGELLSNNHTLRFFHFTKLGPMGRKMLERYAGNNYQVYELWKWYEWQVENYTIDHDFKWYFTNSKS